VQFKLCEGNYVQQAHLAVPVDDKMLFYCLDEDGLMHLISNIVLMEGYIQELKVIIHGIANVKEE
jgi:hypothetical protein